MSPSKTFSSIDKLRVLTQAWRALVRIAILCLPASSVYAAPGDLDSAFGTGGRVITSIGAADAGRCVVVQSDGKIVVAGTSVNANQNDFAVVRYSAGGALDESFGTGGRVTTDLGGGDDYVWGLALQSDGRIVLGGQSRSANVTWFAVARYMENGALDDSFGTDGMVLSDVNTAYNYGRCLALQPDGKILVGGTSEYGSNFHMSLLRYTADGGLDVSFGTGGRVSFDIAGSESRSRSVAVQGDGRIVVTGLHRNSAGNDDFALVRYTADGVLDAGFGTGGAVYTDFGGADIGHSLALQSDGKIVVAGYADGDLALARYSANGALDPGFGTGGKVKTDLGSTTDSAFGVVLQSDGKIVVTGETNNVGGRDLALVRYTANGAPDPGFGAGGRVKTDFSGRDDFGYSVALQSDGKIVVAGSSSEDFVVARYEGGEPAEIAVDHPAGTDLIDGSARVEFGTVSIGSSSNAREFVIRNAGPEVLTLRSLTKDGANPADFTMETTAMATTLAAGGSTSFTVTFAPVGNGPRAAALHIASNDGDENPFDIALSGNPPAEILVEHPAGSSLTDGGAGIAFGTVQSGGSSAAKIVAIRNAGQGPLSIGAFTMGGANPADFSVDVTGTTTTLPPGGSTTFAVTFTPTVSGPRSAALSIVNNDSNENPFDIALSGNPPPEISVEHPAGISLTDGRASIAFGRVNPGGSSAATIFAIRNAGEGPLSLGAFTMGGADPGDFHVDLTGTSSTIPPHANTSFRVAFVPTTSSPRSAVLHIASDDPDENPFDIDFSGNPVPSEFDTTFGLGGKVSTSVGSGGDIGTGVAVQSDGKIVLAGFSFPGSTADFSLVRYNPNGSLDTSFGNGGKVTTAVGSGDDNGQAVVVQSNGRIVVAGYSSNGSDDDFALARYTASGTLDTSFGTGGKVTTPIGSGNDYGWSVAVQSDGKMLVAGESYQSSTGTDIALMRYTPGGALDPSFGNGGKVITDVAGKNNDARSVVLQSDGRIVVAGSAFNGVNNDFALARYNADGTLDANFGANGTVITRIGSGDDTGRCVALQDDGKIVVIGYTWNGRDNDFGLVRYNADGTVDPGFGSGGVAATPVGSSYDEATSVAVQRDGKILVAGYSSNGSNDDFALVRFTAGGALDASFAPGGKVTTDFGDGDNYGRALALQADGAILVAGYSYGRDSFLSSFSLVRYLGDSPLTSIESWRVGWFGSPDNVGNAADLADTNGNGIVNLLEYALGGDPVGNTNGHSILPEATAGDGNRLQFTFTRPLDRPDLTLTVSAADSLTGPWSPLARSNAGGGFEILVPGAAVDETVSGEIRNVTVSDLYPMLAPMHPRRFMRLEATR